MLGGAAAVVAACGGESTDNMALRKFVAGTWFFGDGPYSNGTDNFVTVSAGGNFVTNVYPHSGRWEFVDGRIQIFSDEPSASTTGSGAFAVASNVPAQVKDTVIDWKYSDDDAFSVPVRWDKSTETLYFTGRDGYRGGTFEIAVSRKPQPARPSSSPSSANRSWWW
ncbi:hypothetical protein [Gordonia sp. PP30]|uniref:hypothetical protein n=1 Tax=unclassified Gordonia (in: high G+C Gram-positive bacteria) TaxID=2657482 RepID=UPI001FFF28CC|nr:hypothetical protein [Gordonia sp. PP30]UQE75081.1 hypothetical protein MYK68_00030 [Gordonia sp. PP30]